MSPPILYFPAYVALFAALTMAIACNAYLDIHYGSFGTEVMLWAIVFAYTLRVGYGQRGEPSESAQFQQKALFIVALLAFFVIFMPTWGLPRAGLYLLAGLQAATNCVTVNRRKFMMALLTSAVMVMFAAAHYRADWTMLFYLVPYMLSVVFALVAEQVSRRTAELQENGPLESGVGGRGAAILAATVAIFVSATLLYSLTPQPTWRSMFWRYGQTSNIAIPAANESGGDGGHVIDGGSTGDGKQSKWLGGAGGQGEPGDQDLAAGAPGTSVGKGYRESKGTWVMSPWPTLKEMREAAQRPGMPRWQSTAIEQAVSVIEKLTFHKISLQKLAQQYIEQAKQWLSANRDNLIDALIVIVIIAMLAAAWLLAREARLDRWLRVHFDHFKLGWLGRCSPGNAGAIEYFRATERLFSMHHVERETTLNVREYLARLQRVHDRFRGEMEEMGELFERARYGDANLAPGELARMRILYRQIYREI